MMIDQGASQMFKRNLDLSDDNLVLSNDEKKNLSLLVKNMAENKDTNIRDEIKRYLDTSQVMGKISQSNKGNILEIQRFIKDYGARQDIIVLRGDDIVLNVRNAYEFFLAMSPEHKEMFVDMLGKDSEILSMIYIYAKSDNKNIGEEYNDIIVGSNHFKDIKSVKDWLYFRGYQMDYGIQRYVDTIDISTPEGKVVFEMINTPYELRQFIEKFATLEKALKTKDENKIREALVDFRLKFLLEFSNGNSVLGKNLFDHISQFLFANYDSGMDKSKVDEIMKAVNTVVANKKDEVQEHKEKILAAFQEKMKDPKFVKFLKDMGYDDRIIKLFDLPETKKIIEEIVIKSFGNTKGKVKDFIGNGFDSFSKVLKSKLPKFKDIFNRNADIKNKVGKSEQDFLDSVQHIMHSVFDPDHFDEYTKKLLDRANKTGKTLKEAKTSAQKSIELINCGVKGDVAAHVLYRGPEVGFDSTKLSFDLIFRKKIEQFGIGLTWEQKKILYSMKVDDEHSLQNAIKYASGYFDHNNKYWANYYSNTQWIRQEAQEAKQEVEKIEKDPKAQEIIQEHKEESQKIDIEHKENSQQIQSMTKESYAKIYHEAITKYSDPERYTVWQSSQGENNKQNKPEKTFGNMAENGVNQTSSFHEISSVSGEIYVPNSLTYSTGNTMENPFFDGKNPYEKILKGDDIFDLNKKLLVELLKKNGFAHIKGFDGTIDDMTKSMGINISEHLRPDDLDRFIKVFAKFMIQSIDTNINKVSADKKVLFERAKKEIIKDHKKGILYLFDILNDNHDMLMALDIYDTKNPGEKLFKKLDQGYDDNIDMFFDKLRGQSQT